MYLDLPGTQNIAPMEPGCPCWIRTGVQIVPSQPTKRPRCAKCPIRIALYPASEAIQNIAIQGVSRHKPDTSGRFNASTPDDRHTQDRSAQPDCRPLLPEIYAPDFLLLV